MLKSLAFTLAVGLVVFSAPVQADEYDVLLREFDADALRQDEKRLLQIGLAFEGLYIGQIDGKWGPDSSQALELYSERETDTWAINAHMAALAWSLMERVGRDGWDFLHLDTPNVSFLFPFDAAEVEEQETDMRYVAWQHTESSLGISVFVADVDETEHWHDWLLSEYEHRGRPHIVFEPGLAVTSFTNPDGVVIHVVSNYTRGEWTTVTLVALAEDSNLLSTVAGSIRVGRSEPLVYPEGGLLEQVVDLAMAWSIKEEDTNAEDGDAGVGMLEVDEAELGGTGTAFVVSDEGHLLTNAHVIDGCEAIAVDGFQATVVGTSSLFDLAVIKAGQLSGKQVAAFAHLPASLNLDIVVVGYPLGEFLGGVNVTRGTVSGMKGLAGSEFTMQISAPVQPGNSGGPVLDASGSVVGVVVSKLDAMLVSEVTGDIPQNVNFAVRGELAKLFLSQNGVEPTMAGPAKGLDPVELGRRAQSITYLVECYQ